LATAHRDAVRLGAVPLRQEIEGVARRSRMVLPEQPRTTGTRAGPHGLTEREVDVLRLLRTGSTNHQVARALFISEKTVSSHVSHILAKLGAGNRGEAVVIAHRLGMA
jgi:DNA-binding NarL/FixJ family response regulator